MLTLAKRKQIEIVTYLIANPGETQVNAAIHFNCTDRTIKRAVARWRHLFQISVDEKLNQTIADLEAMAQRIERQIKHVEKYNKSQVGRKDDTPAPLDARGFSALSQQYRQTITLIAELQGIYKNSIKLEVDEENVLNKFIEAFDAVKS